MWLTPEKSQGPGRDVWGQLGLGPRCVFTSFPLTIQFWRWASLKGNYRLSNLLARCLMWRTRLRQSDNSEIKQDSNCYWKKKLSRRIKNSLQPWPHPSCPIWAGSLNWRGQQALGTSGIRGDLFWESGPWKTKSFPIGVMRCLLPLGFKFWRLLTGYWEPAHWSLPWPLSVLCSFPPAYLYLYLPLSTMHIKCPFLSLLYLWMFPDPERMPQLKISETFCNRWEAFHHVRKLHPKILLMQKKVFSGSCNWQA